MLLNPRGQIENELDTHIPAGVIDRLRLSTIHTRKIRCTNKESLPQATTTERLLKSLDLQVHRELFLSAQRDSLAGFALSDFTPSG